MDLVEQFLDYTEGLNSPDNFRLWGGITAVAASLERRVWVTTGAGPCFPNLYTMLVAIPGIGKGQVIDTVADLWREGNWVQVSPDSMTKSALLDFIELSKRSLLKDEGKKMVEYSSVAVAAEEFGVFIPAHDTEFLSFLIRIYNNPPHLEEKRRVSKSAELAAPQLNLLCGSQPDFLAHLLPEEAWGMGFMSRMMMIYAAKGPTDWDVFTVRENFEEKRKAMTKALSKLQDLYGEMPVEPSAKEVYRKWRQSGFEPKPDHSKLRHYNSRRPQLILKLAITAAISRGSLKIEGEDIERVKVWMQGAEKTMPDIFREMSRQSDEELLNELRATIWAAYSKTKKPIPEAAIIKWLSTRVTSDRIQRVMDVAEKSGLLQKWSGTSSYTPGAVDQTKLD